MSIPESASIRRRVFTLGAALLACALIGLVFFLRDYAHRAAEQAFDRLLAASALTIAGSVQIEDDGVTVEPPVSAHLQRPADHRLRRPGARAAAGAGGNAGVRVCDLSR
ncbi:hypothetical protein G6F65_021836 [Rhizopus arrhizus]|nr:hypothetical protein G6F65_021836 [Rhizopus arrhizus]